MQIADQGTLFLDEISEIPLDLQGKLLEFIQEKEFLPLGSEKKSRVDVRIICATNKDLRQMVENHAFREDLYYRINTFEVQLPPLRERPEDVQALIDHFLSMYNRTYMRSLSLSDKAREILIQYRWPGNIRELAHIMEKIVVLTDGDVIKPGDIPNDIYEIKGRQAGAPGAWDGNTPGSLGMESAGDSGLENTGADRTGRKIAGLETGSGAVMAGTGAGAAGTGRKPAGLETDADAEMAGTGAGAVGTGRKPVGLETDADAEMAGTGAEAAGTGRIESGDVKDMKKTDTGTLGMTEMVGTGKDGMKKMTLREALEETERRMVTEVYARCGNSVKAAAELGVSQPTAYRLIRKYCC